MKLFKKTLKLPNALKKVQETVRPRLRKNDEIRRPGQALSTMAIIQYWLTLAEK